VNGSHKPTLKFPCEFPLKIIGEQADDFPELVLTIVRRHVPDLDERGVSSRLSSGGKYCSVSCEFVAKSRAQVDDLYRELTAHPRIRWVL
jgi:putative lipoic acid-binding regulatory protein